MKPTVYRNPAAGSAGADPTDPEAIVRVVLEKSPLLIYIANLEFKIVLANRALREVTGYDTGDCPNVESLIERFYPHGDAYAQRVRDIHEGWRRNEHIMGAKLLVQCKDGGQRTVAWYTSRLRIGRSPTVGYIAMGLDLTTQGTLEQWVGLLQRTLQHLTEGVVLTDANGAILAWNAGASNLLGQTEEQMQGQSFNQLFVRGEREIVGRTIDSAVNGEQARFEAELELNRADGGTRVLSFTQTRLDGEGGVPLARLTVLAPPGEDGGEKLGEIKAELEASRARSGELEGEVSSLLAKVSALDATLATTQAAAGQIADLRGQLNLAEEAETDAKTRLKKLEEELAQERKAHEGDVASTSQELQTARDEAAAAKDLQARIDALEAELKTAQEEAATNKTAADEARAALDEAKAQAGEAEGQAKATSDEALAKAKAEADEALDAAQTAANEALAAARRESEEALATAKKESEEALAAAKKESEDALAEAAAAATAAAEELAAAKAAAEETAGRLAAVETELAGRTEELETARTRIAELEELTSDEGAKLAELESKLTEAAAALDKAEEDFGNDRARLQEEHRKELEAQSKKGAAERKTLEEQLHKDILAAEERSEVELQKLNEKHEKERRDLEQAAEIAQAEIESAAQQSIQEVKTKLETYPSLADHLGTVAELAVVSADTSGKVLAWSAGAAALDGRSAEDAVGKVIHEDVLQLDGAAWKTMFGTIMIKGSLQKEVTLITRSGARRQVELRASLVKNEQGAPVGLTEVIRLPEVEGGLELHAAAALGHLVKPVREMLDVRTLAGLAASEEATRAARGLVRLGQTVVEGARLADIESVARSEGLAESLDAAEEGLMGQALSWREMRMTLQDLEQLEASVAGDRTTWRWNELVERCLHATNASRATRQYGDAGAFNGSGEAVVPLLLGLLTEAPDGGSGLTVATGRSDGRLTLSIVGRAWDSEQQRRASWLAGEAGGEVTFTGAIAKIAVPAGAVEQGGDAPTLLAFDAQDIAEVQALADEDGEDIVAIEAEEMDEEEEILELDEAPTGPVDDRSTLEMSGVSDADLEDDDDDLPSDHPVLASGSVDLMDMGEDDELMLMAGEDSIIKSADAVYMAVRSIDDADPILGNSKPVLARAGGETPELGEDAPVTQSELEPLQSLEEVSNGAPDNPVPPEAASTDDGGGAMAAPKTSRRKSSSKSRGRKRKRSSRKKK